MVYTNRRRGALFMVLGAVILVLGVFVLSIAVSGDSGELGICCFPLFGMWIGFIGLTCLRRITVDIDGLTITYWFRSFHDPWDTLKSWVVDNVKAGDSAGTRYVEFDFGGRYGPYWIEEHDVLIPGFEQFVEDVRSHAGAKERVQNPEKA